MFVWTQHCLLLKNLSVDKKVDILWKFNMERMLKKYNLSSLTVLTSEDIVLCLSAAKNNSGQGFWGWGIPSQTEI